MSGVQHSAPKPFWMRSLSFAGLHRLLHVIHDAPGGLRATEVNHRVLSGELTLSRSNAKPKPTTLYHYRNTLFRLGTIGHDGKHLIPKLDNPHVEGLLETQPPANDVFELSAVARRHFAALVLQNQQCRELFFDLFMLPGNEYASLADFSEKGIPVSWALTKPSAEEPPHSPLVPLKQRRRSRKPVELTLQNIQATERSAKYGHAAGHLPVVSLLYGVRYWARDELLMVDEYSTRSESGAVMFPVGPQPEAADISDDAVAHAIRFLLDNREPKPWTVYSINELIVHYCQKFRRPRTTLFRAIEWLWQNRPGHIHLIGTSVGIATLTAVSPQQENMALRNYYKSPDGPYVSHFRIHREIDTIGIPEQKDPRYGQYLEPARP